MRTNLTSVRGFANKLIAKVRVRHSGSPSKILAKNAGLLKNPLVRRSVCQPTSLFSCRGHPFLRKFPFLVDPPMNVERSVGGPPNTAWYCPEMSFSPLRRKVARDSWVRALPLRFSLREHRASVEGARTHPSEPSGKNRRKG